MTTGDRERYEQLADPAMYWTQLNGEPVRDQVPMPPRRADGDRPGADGDEPTTLAPNPYAELGSLDDVEAPREDDGEAATVYAPPGGYSSDDLDEEQEVEWEARRRERFGGVNWGAGFFGWLVAVSVTTLLAAVAGVALVLLSRNVAEVATTIDNDPRTTGLVAAALAVSVLLIGYFSGGYVAGRMSRYDGGRQGAAVWVTGVMLGALAAGLGLVLGSEYNLLSRVDLPSVSLPAETFGPVGLVTVAVAALGSLLAAVGGGKVGCRYHAKVDGFL